MLGYWRSHEKFQLWLEQKLLSFLPELEQQIRFYSEILEKVYILNLDTLLPVAMSRYSFTGRPSQNQPEIFRALVAMTHLKEGITSFVERVNLIPSWLLYVALSLTSFRESVLFTTSWIDFGWHMSHIKFCVNRERKNLKNQSVAKNYRMKIQALLPDW